MAQLDLSAAETILTTCRANASGVVASFAGCFGGEWEVAFLNQATPVGGTVGPDSEPGLVLVFKVEGGAALLFWPESTGLLPDWVRETSPTNRAKLLTLAQELGTLVFPDSATPTEFGAYYLTNLANAWSQAHFTENGAAITLKLTSGERVGAVQLAWLATQADRLNPEAAPAPSAASSAAVRPPREPMPIFAPPEPPSFDEALAHLPPYMRSLLRIKVKLTVSLAATRQPVRRIVELGPGSIIQFEKRCDEALELQVDGQEIAVGEAVKVGDKFGLRVSSMVLPKERFLPLRK